MAQRLADQVADYMATGGVAAAANFKLSNSSDWDDWISRIERHAMAYGLWRLIDPANEVKPPQREEPPLPLCLKTNGREGKMAELSVYTMNNNLYQAEQKNLLRVFEYIIEHISPELYKAVVPAVVDHHPWELLCELQARVAPSRFERLSQVHTKYRQLCETPKKEDILTWCDEWEKLVVKAQKCNLFDRHSKMPIMDFLTAVRPYHEDLAYNGLRAISFENFDGFYTLHDFVNGIRQWKRDADSQTHDRESDSDGDSPASTLRGSEISKDQIKAELRAEFKNELEELKQELMDQAEAKDTEVKASIMATVSGALISHLGTVKEALIGTIDDRLESEFDGIQYTLRGEVRDACTANKAELHTVLESQRSEFEEQNRRQFDNLKTTLEKQVADAMTKNGNQNANVTLAREVEGVKAEIGSQHNEHEAKLENQYRVHKAKFEKQHREHEAKLEDQSRVHKAKLENQIREMQELKKTLEEKATRERPTGSTSDTKASSPASTSSSRTGGKIIHRNGKCHWSPPPCPCGEVHYYYKCMYINKALRPSGWQPDQDVMQKVQTHLTDPINEDKAKRSLGTWKKGMRLRMMTAEGAGHAADVEGSGYAESVSDGVPLWPNVLTERVEV